MTVICQVSSARSVWLSASPAGACHRPPAKRHLTAVSLTSLNWYSILTEHRTRGTGRSAG